MKQIKIITLLYLSTLATRLFQLSQTYLYPDEITWMVRGKELIYSLLYRNLDYFQTAWWTDTHQVEAIGLPLSFLNGLFHFFLAGQGRFSLHLLPDLIASRLAVILLVSLLPPLIYYFVRQFSSSTKLALLAALLYLFNPISLGLDRYLLHDSLLTLFSFAAIAFYLLDHKKNKLSFWPGIFLSLAFLTKPNGLLPILVWLTLTLLHHRSKFSWKLFIFNSASFLLATSLLWPASWFNLLTAIPEYLLRQQQLVGAGIVTSYYLGQASLNPHWSYYLFQLTSRLPEVILFGFFLSLFFYLKTKDSKKAYFNQVIAVLSYCLAFLLLISFSSQKLGIRYALPLLPWIVIAAAVGWQQVMDRVSRSFRRILVILIVLGSLYPLFYHPHYYLYYNLIIGDPKQAQKYDLVGLCFGSPPALAYLNQSETKGTIFIAGCQDVAPYYTSLPLTKDAATADYLIIEHAFTQQFPNDPLLKRIEGLPLASFNLFGAPVSHLYAADQLEASTQK